MPIISHARRFCQAVPSTNAITIEARHEPADCQSSSLAAASGRGVRGEGVVFSSPRRGLFSRLFSRLFSGLFSGPAGRMARIIYAGAILPLTAQPLAPKQRRGEK